MTEQKQYEIWLHKATEDADLVEELHAIQGDEKEIAERFYRNLSFGTGGLRGVLGAGTNRINIYTVRKASQGLANYLCKQTSAPSVAIAHDSRIKSRTFAREAARVLAANGVQVYLYRTLMPTPALSYAVRALHCDAGVVVTASHNPAKYNGYKVYGADGCQITLEAAESILSEIEALNLFEDVRTIPFQQGLDAGSIAWISLDVVDGYLDAVSAECLQPDLSGKDALSIVYTPLNGAGLMCVKRTLTRNGFTHYIVVPEQEHADGHFPTCPYPNPEIEEALSLGLSLCRKEDADLLLATDPDCDRCGIAVRHANDYQLLTGNEVGVLLFDYICRQRTAQHTMPEAPIVVKTIVTTEMIAPIAAHYGVQVRNVLTGFKFIGEQIGLLEQQGQEERYLFGFEESYGYLSGGYVRDKDAVNASLLICEMTAYYRNQGKTLIDVLNELYASYGAYVNALQSFTFEGMDGFETMQTIMASFRAQPPREILGHRVVCVSDYACSLSTYADGRTEIIDLPASDVVKFDLADGITVVVRPSGTEPKLKLYYSVKGDSIQQAQALVQALQVHFKAQLQP